MGEATVSFGGVRRRRPVAVGVALTLLVCALAGLALGSGHQSFSLREMAEILWSGPHAFHEGLPDGRSMIVWHIRMPRIAVCLAAGAALALSGAVFQGLLLNPLADPYTLGVSSGAAFGASVVIVGGLLFPACAALAAPWAVTVGAFLAACLTLCLVIVLARDGEGGMPPANLILAGVVLSAILSAALSFLKYLAGDQVGSIVFWLLGSFQARTWTDAAVVAGFFLPALCASLLFAVDLNVMTTGNRSAQSLGVDTRRVRPLLLAAASLAAAAAVSVAGIIGFVGLIVPHLVRLVSGPDHRSLLPLSALGGAALMVGADTLVRVALPGEIPVGVLTALLAGPAFLVLFRRRMRGSADG